MTLSLVTEKVIINILSNSSEYNKGEVKVRRVPLNMGKVTTCIKRLMRELASQKA